MRVDRPIIFSSPMVRALLDGRKTMTRRLAWRDGAGPLGGPARAVARGAGKASPWQRVRPGDRLWVREAWKPHSIYADTTPRNIPQSKVFYAADDTYAPSNTAWRPSIHMPRWASRLTLIVTATKIERLQALTDADAFAEGIARFDDGLHFQPSDSPFVRFVGRTPRDAFAGLLWDWLHGAGSWAANPEVVVLTFTVEKRNIDDCRPADTEESA